MGTKHWDVLRLTDKGYVKGGTLTSRDGKLSGHELGQEVLELLEIKDEKGLEAAFRSLTHVQIRPMQNERSISKGETKRLDKAPQGSEK